MRNNFRFMVGLAIMALASGAASFAQAVAEVGKSTGLDFEESRRHRGKGRNNRRGTGAASRPKKHPNRLTISKRVRRKHRRAA